MLVLTLPLLFAACGGGGGGSGGGTDVVAGGGTGTEAGGGAGTGPGGGTGAGGGTDTGSGTGAGGGTGTGGGTGAGSVTVTNPFPSSLTIVRPENFQGPFNALTAQVYAPDDEAPTALALTGPEAHLFRLELLITDPPSATGYRSVTVRIIPNFTFNYERPQDANRDNIYNFTATGMYRGTTITVGFTITITDVNDQAETAVTYIAGETNMPRFGHPLIAVPDISGDGRFELGMSLQDGISGATGFIIPSQFIDSRTTSVTQISTLQNAGTRFTDKTVVNAIEQNYLSASISSGGNSVMISDAGDQKLYLYPSLTAEKYDALRGRIDPTMVTDRITYSFAGGPEEGRLIGDVNGDGIADILTRSTSRTAPTSGKINLIFGRAATSAADRQRTTAPNISMNYTWLQPGSYAVHEWPIRFSARLISDVDGDGFSDLVILSPDYQANQRDENKGAVWLIKSAVLRSTTNLSVDLDTLTASQGFRIIGGDITTVAEISDLDNDGYRTLVFGTASGLYAIDGHDFGALAPVSQPPFGANPPPIFGPKSALVFDGIWQVTDGFDLDRDNLEDLLASGPLGTVLTIFRASRIRDALANASFNPTDTTGIFQVQARAFTGVIEPGEMSAGLPVALRGSTVIALPIYHHPFLNPGGQGRIIFVRIADISAAMVANRVRTMEMYLAE